jgi:pilus assembly protein Flp/PilA
MPNQGWAPLTVHLGTFGSRSTAAPVAHYEWDLDGDLLPPQNSREIHTPQADLLLPRHSFRSILISALIYLDLFGPSFIYFSLMGGFIMLHVCTAKGQGLVEFALLLVLVAIVVIGALQALGPNVSELLGQVVDTVQIASGSPSGAIVGVSARWQHWWFITRVRVEVKVSQPSTIVSTSIIDGSGHLDPSSQTCEPDTDCVFLIRWPSSSGTVSVAGGGGSKTASW